MRERKHAPRDVVEEKGSIVTMRVVTRQGATWRARLKAARQAKGLTQKQLSALIGKKSASAVQSWESEHGFEPSLSDWPVLAEILEKPPCWLVFGEEGQTIPEHPTTHDRDLLGRCIAETIVALDRHNVILTPERTATVLLAVYDMMRETGEHPDLRAAIARLIHGDRSM